jgi:hypothetical protein
VAFPSLVTVLRMDHIDLYRGSPRGKGTHRYGEKENQQEQEYFFHRSL